MKRILISKDILKEKGEDVKKYAIEEAKRDFIKMIENTPAEKLVTIDDREYCWEIEIDCKIA